ncbi:YqzL family protein [Vallitalea sp.]|jgi:hypothetical protein|uniref:YqzL family protein n=1 Tax=Vallitalea sp. TaxID=1882829 RepID=UPI0025F92355|nr:YqzL family protein [Vallitalea sp.]MCT4686809.1 hypothetical protein [Vallitalea sp.]
MFKNILWNLFENTGRIDVYLIYKQYEPSGSTYSSKEINRTYENKKCANSDIV